MHVQIFFFFFFFFFLFFDVLFAVAVVDAKAP